MNHLVPRSFFFLLVCILSLARTAQAQCDAEFLGPSKQCLGDTSVFSRVANVDIIASQWDFGDAQTDTGQTVTHVYAQTGTYVVQHIIEELGGCKDTAYDTVEVIVAPRISFTSDANCTDDFVFLYATKTFGPTDSLGPLTWHTGTGDSLIGDTISYDYPASGYYNLTVRSQGTACLSLLDTQVFIRQKPTASFSTNNQFCKGDTVLFQFNGTAYKPTYQWNFGDVFSGISNTDSVANPRHRFTNSGTYSIRLVITDTLQCRDTLTYSIIIKQDANASFDYTNGCFGLQTQFSSTTQIDALDTILTYFWDFDDGDTSSAASPLHAYSDTGTYAIRLIIETSSGCLDTTELSTPIFPQPIITLDDDSTCRGSSVNFQLSNPSSLIQNYLWNFGDGFTSTSLNPAHQYTANGKYYTTLRTGFTNGKTCTSKLDSVLVFSLPSASFTINNDTQCFKGNDVCVTIRNQSPNTLRRRVLFDDGFVDVSNGPTDSLVCHTYSDISGGSYFIAVQMLDSNGCSQSLSSDTAVVIHPEFDTDFTQNTSNGCFVTHVSFGNTSNQSPPDIVDYYWDFGDGTTNTTNWNTPNHTYSTNGSFTVKLWAENSDGCRDSSLGSSSITNVTFTVDAAIDSVFSGCASNNRIFASQTPVPGATIIWVWQSGDTSVVYSPVYSYEFPGSYVPFVQISLNGCDSMLFLDTIEIAGPYARFGPITNRYQCEVVDTVYANNASVYFSNVQHGAIWDFGDAFAPSCTTNYLAGVNATSNCRYATDSVNTKHFYDPNQEACYSIRLIAYDSFSGCSDTAIEFVALTPPEAGPDIAMGLQGLFTLQSQTCLGPEEDKEISISLTQTQPLCGQETYWVMWDSACAAASGNFNANWIPLSYEHNYGYDNAPCDPDGYVTIGLIIQNGDDSLGNVCRDTAWYNRILHFNFMDPRFGSSYDSSQYYCKGSSFDFFLSNQNQDSVERVVWHWGDGQITDTNTIDTVSHQFTESGTYVITNEIYTTDGCTGSDTFTLNVGISASIGFTSNALCLGDSFQILPNLNYLNDGTAYWNDSTRLQANKEALFFDLGDGNGFQDLGSQPWVYTDAIKNYSISIAYRDSLMCWDTLNYSDSVRVFGVFASFSTLLDTFLCPQAIAFSDLSSLYDSVANNFQADDFIEEWNWQFGAGLANSSLQNPERFLNTGTYHVQLRVTNTVGCADSISHEIVIVGPQAHYSIQSDSFGCESLRVYFVNESSNATNYVWQFNDSSNAVLSTSSDTVFYFDYALYGNFVPTLTAQGTFNQDGIIISCQSVFPDSTASDSLRLISVYETPVAEFSFLTDCATRSSTFSNESFTENSSTLTYLWEFGDGDTSSQENPTHIYADTGHYTVILHVFSELNCEDTVGMEVIIAPQPIAWFTFNEVCLGTSTLFEDSTEAFNDLIYDWQWDFGDGGGSTLDNPFHDYAQDSTYTVQLVVTNIGGCRDTVTRALRIHSFPSANYTASSECRYDSVTFSNSSSSAEMPLSYTWDFGDASTSNIESPKHLYSTSGTKLVSLKVETVWGCADSTLQAAAVFQEPNAAFSINDNAQCFSEQNFLFSDQSTAGTGSYAVTWAFGDGNSATGSAASHSYLSDGSFTVFAYVLSSVGCADTAQQTLDVFPSSVAGFTINDAFQCEYGNEFQFTDTSSISSGNINRTWLNGDGGSSSDSIYSYHYADTGYYEVSLIQTSNNGCRDTIRKTVLVNPSPRANFVLNDSTQCVFANLFVVTNTTQIASGTTNANWNFGDGGNSVQANPSYSFALDSVWTIRLIAISDSGCYDTAYHGAITYPMPLANFARSDSSSCLSGNLFSFYDSSSIKTGTLTLRWFFGDADSSTSNAPTHSFAAEGIYAPSLIATSNVGCTDTFVSQIEVFPMPNALIGSGDTALCFRDNTFAFTDSSSIIAGVLSREWSFGDGNTDTSENTLHSYAADGNYVLALRVYSAYGCSDSAFENIVVYPQAKAAFSINDSIQCFSNHLFVLTNSSQVNSGTLSYAWDFGDGNTDVATQPSHAYLTHGSYTITLEAQTPFLCADTLQKIVRIDPNPVAKIGLSDSLLCYRDHVFDFVDSSSIASGTTQREWSFGDGNLATNLITTHSYASEGVYVVALRVQSDLLCTDSSFRTYEVYPQATSAFQINDSVQCFNGHLFSFNNQSSLSAGLLSYSWDFGDNSGDVSTNPNHTYSVFGDYAVTLIAQTPQNCADTVQKAVRINPNPATKIGLNDSFQCINAQSFAFIDSSSIAEGSYTLDWDLGDGNFNQQSSFIHPYLTLGVHTVKLVLMSDKNCADSSTLNIEVYPKPDPNFVINDSAQCENDQLFSFTDQSTISSGTITPLWNFGDGSDTLLQNPNKWFNYADTFRVVLEITSNHGCVDSTFKQVIVFPKPHATWTINDTAQCVNTNDFQFLAQTTIASGSFQNYFWDLESVIDTGDLDTARTYSSSGNYPVLFYVQSMLNCWDTLQNTLTVHPKPHARFAINDSDQCINTQQIQFSNLSTISSGTLSYFWDFGDGDNSTDFEPNKTYLTHDSLLVVLYAESDLGCFDTTSQQMILLPKPSIEFTVNDSDQCVNGNLYTFTNGSTIDYGVLSYTWDFGNGESAISADTLMVYATQNMYPVELKAISDVGCSDSLTRIMIVYPKPNPGFSVNDEGQCFNTQDFLFTDESIIDYGQIHYTYRFGDLNEDTNASPAHYYSVFGNYTVRQVLESDHACKDSIEREIRVFPKPSAQFTSNDSTQCINTQDFQFTSTSTVAAGVLQNEYWNFDDGNTAIGRQVTHYYPNSNFYQVQFRVQSDSNCWDTLWQQIRVFPKPTAAIDYNDSAQCLSTNDYRVFSTASDSTGIAAWNWDIDNDSTAIDSNFTYHFKTIGMKTFTQRVRSLDGCWDTTSRMAYVKPMPDPTFTGLSTFHCNNVAPFALIPVVPGGTFTGTNIVNQLFEPRILWHDTVHYWVEVNGCADSSQQITQVYPFPVVDLGSDTVLCKNEFIDFDLTFWGADYALQGFNSEPQFRINKAGVYFVEVSNICGIDYDTITLEYLNDLCRIYLPNAFTPNGDDYHQNYKPVGFGLDKMDYIIYNRWGQIVYTGNIDDIGWDGTFQGSKVSQDVYVVVVRYQYSLHGETISGYLNGNITLIR